MVTDSIFCNPCGVGLIKTFEGCQLNAYQDQGGRWTIGWGCTGEGIIAGTVWTQAQADGEFDSRLAVLEDEICQSLGPQANLSSNQFSALCSLGWNIGISALAGSSALQAVKMERFISVPGFISLWNKITIGGKLVLSPGLARRRRAECELWNLPPVGPCPNWSQFQ